MKLLVILAIAVVASISAQGYKYGSGSNEQTGQYRNGQQYQSQYPGSNAYGNGQQYQNQYPAGSSAYGNGYQGQNQNRPYPYQGSQGGYNTNTNYIRGRLDGKDGNNPVNGK